MDKYLSYIPDNIDRNRTELWYAVYVRSRHEKKVATEFRQRNIQHFLPLIPRLHQWKDRKKYVDMPIFPGYVFVRMRLADRLKILSVQGVAWIISFRNMPAPIPESQVENVRRALTMPELIRPAEYLNEGDPVKIIHGPFRGVTGKLIKKHGEHQLLVSIDLIKQAVSLKIDSSWLKPAKEFSAYDNKREIRAVSSP
ncbi:UpxY family transcription antiterminator [candidate division KSB1 bacterium]|nr:UpxY family transcription antiterminator [candidate division KSB1 bacterium]